MLIEKPQRRRFLGGALAAAAAAALPLKNLRAAAPAAQGGADAWLAEVPGQHRCFFDFNAHKNGVPLLHILNYINTYMQAHGAQAGQVGAVGSFYGIGGGSSIALGFDDATWAKYGLGEYLNLKDASGRPYTRNVFHRPTEADGHLLSQAMNVPALPMFGGAMVACGIENLQKMGTKFLMCNNALGAWTFELAARGKGEQATIAADLLQHLLPNVTIVPAMVVAIERAQAAGVSYNRQ
jgi:intracellular sulfur oxidation DsrE/DsrF family protein